MATTLATAYFQLVPSMGGNESKMRNQINSFATSAGQEGGRRLGSGMSAGAASSFGSGSWSSRMQSVMNSVGQRLGSNTGNSIGSSISRGLGSVLTNTNFQGMLTPMVNGMQRTASIATQTLGRGIAAAGAIGEAGLAGLATLITQSIPVAIERADTLNRFPKMMKNMGYSAEEASQSIKTIGDRLDGLPTATNEVAQTVQRLGPLVKGGMTEATDVALALNDAMLAGSGSSVLAAAGMEQYAQMLAVGVPDMQAWRSLVRAMPAQLDQVARALLGPTANSMELYNAMKEGTVTFDDFNKALVDLDKNGAEGLASFSEQARDSVKGIDTSLRLMVVRMGKAMADLFTAIGVDRISGALDRISYSYKGLGQVIGSALTNPVNESSKSIGGWLLMFSGVVTAVETAFNTFTRFDGVFGGLVQTGSKAINTFFRWVSLFASLWTSSEKFRQACKDLANEIVSLFQNGEGVSRIWGDMHSAATKLAKTLGDSLADIIHNYVIPGLEKLNNILGKASEWFRNLSDDGLDGFIKKALEVVAAITMITGPSGLLKIGTTAASAVAGLNKIGSSAAKGFEGLVDWLTKTKPAADTAAEGVSKVSQAAIDVGPATVSAKKAASETAEAMGDLASASANVAPATRSVQTAAKETAEHLDDVAPAAVSAADGITDMSRKTSSVGKELVLFSDDAAYVATQSLPSVGRAGKTASKELEVLEGTCTVLSTTALPGMKSSAKSAGKAAAGMADDAARAGTKTSGLSKAVSTVANAAPLAGTALTKTGASAATAGARTAAAGISMGGVVAILGGIAVAAAGVVLAFKNWDKIKDAGNKIKEWLGPASESFRKWATELPTNIANWGSGVRNSIRKWCTDAADAIPGAVKGITDAISRWANNDVPNTLSDSKGNMTTGLEDALGGMPSKAKEMGGKIIDNIITGMKGLGKALSTLFLDTIPGILHDVARGGQDIAQALVDAFLTFDWFRAAGDVGGRIGRFVSDCCDKAKDWFDQNIKTWSPADTLDSLFGKDADPGSFFNKVAEWLGIDDFVDDFTKWWDSIDWGEVCSHAKDNITEGIATAISGAIDALSSIGSFALDIGATLLGWLVDGVAWCFSHPVEIINAMIAGIEFCGKVVIGSLGIAVEIGKAIWDGIMQGIVEAASKDTTNQELWNQIEQALKNPFDGKHGLTSLLSEWDWDWNPQQWFRNIAKKKSNGKMSSQEADDIFYDLVLSSIDKNGAAKGLNRAINDFYSDLGDGFGMIGGILDKFIAEPVGNFFSSFNIMGMVGDAFHIDLPGLFGDFDIGGFLETLLVNPIAAFFGMFSFIDLAGGSFHIDLDALFGHLGGSSVGDFLMTLLVNPIAAFFGMFSFIDLAGGSFHIDLDQLFGTAFGNFDVGGFLETLLVNPIAAFFGAFSFIDLAGGTFHIDLDKLFGSIDVGSWLQAAFVIPLGFFFSQFSFMGLAGSSFNIDLDRLFGQFDVAGFLQTMLVNPIAAFCGMFSFIDLAGGTFHINLDELFGVVGGFDVAGFLTTLLVNPIAAFCGMFSFVDLAGGKFHINLDELFGHVDILGFLDAVFIQPIKRFFDAWDWKALAQGKLSLNLDELMGKDNVKQSSYDAMTNNVYTPVQTSIRDKDWRGTMRPVQNGTNQAWRSIEVDTRNSWNRTAGTVNTTWGTMNSYTATGGSRVASTAGSRASDACGNFTRNLNPVINNTGNTWRSANATAEEKLAYMKQMAANQAQATNRGYSDGIRPVVQAARNIFQDMNNAIHQVLQNTRDIVVGVCRSIPDSVGGALSGLSTIGWNAGVALGNGLQAGIQACFGSIMATCRNLTAALPNWKGPYEVDKVLLTPNGIAIMEGLLHGMEDVIPQIQEMLEGLTADIPAMVDTSNLNTDSLLDGIESGEVQAMGAPHVTIVNNNPREQTEPDQRRELAEGLLLAEMLR